MSVGKKLFSFPGALSVQRDKSCGKLRYTAGLYGSAKKTEKYFRSGRAESVQRDSPCGILYTNPDKQGRLAATSPQKISLNGRKIAVARRMVVEYG